jgi:HK97 family phage portal protein
VTLLGRAWGRQTRAAGEWGDSTPPAPGAGPAGGAVGPDQALRVATALSCGLAVSEDIGMLPLAAYRRPRVGGVVPVSPAPTIVTDPFAEDITRISPQTGVAQIVMSLLFRGNAYAQVADRDRAGMPAALVVLAPDRVTVRSEDGARVYRVNGVRVPIEDIVHIMGPSLPGADTGLSVIEYQRTLFGLGLAIGQYSLGWFERGASPAGLLKSKRPLNGKQAKDLRRSFESAHAGVGRSHGIAVVSGDVDYQGLSLKPEDSAWLESMQLVREDICGLFGVPAWRVGIRSGANSPESGAVLDASGAAYLRHTLLRWTSRLERAWTRMIPGGLTYAAFDYGAFQKADASTRWRNYMLARTLGAQTVNEIRTAEGWVALDTPGANDPMQPLNSAHATAGDASPAAGLDAPPAPEEGQ